MAEDTPHIEVRLESVVFNYKMANADHTTETEEELRKRGAVEEITATVTFELVVFEGGHDPISLQETVLVPSKSLQVDHVVQQAAEKVRTSLTQAAEFLGQHFSAS